MDYKPSSGEAHPSTGEAHPLAAEFRRQTAFYLAESRRKIDAVWADLSEAEAWSRPNEQTLAPANQLIHLTGNLRQWVLSAVGGQPDERSRDAEFAARGGRGKADVYAAFAAVYDAVVEQLAADGPALTHPLTVQGHATTVLGVWVHVTEHLSYHTGQLVFYGKQLRGREYDLYAGWELDTHV